MNTFFKKGAQKKIIVNIKSMKWVAFRHGKKEYQTDCGSFDHWTKGCMKIYY